MKNNEKRDLILDAMQQLMEDKDTSLISVSDIAKEAGIGKGSIYYYFKSKEDILNAVIERSYSYAIEHGKTLLTADHMDALTKMEIIFTTCRDSSLELSRQVSGNFLEMQQSAFLHQQYIRIMVKNLKPILSDIIRQGIKEGTISCETPEEVAEIVLILLTIKLDKHFTEESDKVADTLSVFSNMLEKSYGIEAGKLDFLWKRCSNA